MSNRHSRLEIRVLVAGAAWKLVQSRKPGKSHAMPTDPCTHPRSTASNFTGVRDSALGFKKLGRGRERREG